MANEKPKMKKVAVKTVLATEKQNVKEAKECMALTATLLKKIENEWIPNIKKEYVRASSLYKKALDISVDNENGEMDVEVTADEGENVQVTDNTTNTGGEAGTNGAVEAPPAETEPPMGDEDIKKTFKLISDKLEKISKSLETKDNKKK